MVAAPSHAKLRKMRSIRPDCRVSNSIGVEKAMICDILRLENCNMHDATKQQNNNLFGCSTFIDTSQILANESR